MDEPGDPAPLPDCFCFMTARPSSTSMAACCAASCFLAFSSFFDWRLMEREKRSPQALQSVFVPVGPLRHSGLLLVPQLVQRFSPVSGLISANSDAAAVAWAMIGSVLLDRSSESLALLGIGGDW